MAQNNLHAEGKILSIIYMLTLHLSCKIMHELSIYHLKSQEINLDMYKTLVKLFQNIWSKQVKISQRHSKMHLK